MLDEFNKQLSSKGMTLLKYISNIIENIDSSKIENLEETSNNELNNTNKLNILLTNEELKYTDDKHIYIISEQNLKIIRSICLNIYGLSTLVINHENLYNNNLFNEKPEAYGIKACSKKHYLEYLF